MRIRTTTSKVLGAVAVLLFGPLLGILIACVLAGFALRSDPNIIANGGHTAPGDGILVMLYAFISLLVSVPLSIWGAVVLAFGTGRQSQLQPAISTESVEH